MTRIEEIEYRIGEIQGLLLAAHHNHNSGFIGEQIKHLTTLQITYKDFNNYTEKAVEIKQDILEKLKVLLSKTLEKKTPYSLEEIKGIVARPRPRLFDEK